MIHIDKNTLIFDAEVAQAAIDTLIKEYKHKVNLYLNDYEVQGRRGSFNFGDRSVKPNVFTWCGGSKQSTLLVLIHELAHYHHFLRCDYESFKDYSEPRCETYAYWIGWCLIKRFGFDSFITRQVWQAYSFDKLWRGNVGLLRLGYKQIEALADGKDDQNRLLIEGKPL